MTRERRIGLLVGLGFIIMFALVLSELTGSGVVKPVVPVVGERAIAWMEDAGPGGGPVRLSARSGTPSPAQRVGEYPAGASGTKVSGEEVIRSSLVRIDEGIRPAAVVDVQMVRRQEPQQAAPEQLADRPKAPGPVTYVVKENDSLARIARKVYGPAHELQYKRIFEANRDKLTDEHVVIVGQKLVIPPLGDREGDRPTAAIVRSKAPTRHYREMTAEELARHFSAGKAGRDSRRVYVVRRGDNLTKIARSLLDDDSPKAIMKIFNANKGKLRSPDSLQVGMKLVIPTIPI